MRLTSYATTLNHTNTTCQVINLKQAGNLELTILPPRVRKTAAGG